MILPAGIRRFRKKEGRDLAENHGFIREKPDIMLLILFVLRRLPAEIDGERLAELVLVDGGLNYFDYKFCLAELVRTSQVEETENGYRITEKGVKNCEALEDTLPWTARADAGRNMAPVVGEMRRSSMILAEHAAAQGGVSVSLSLSDGLGSILDVRILAADEAQAAKIERNFNKNAESLYHRLLLELSGEGG